MKKLIAFVILFIAVIIGYQFIDNFDPGKPCLIINMYLWQI